jgi:hypothetical protein
MVGVMDIEALAADLFVEAVRRGLAVLLLLLSRMLRAGAPCCVRWNCWDIRQA